MGRSLENIKLRPSDEMPSYDDIMRFKHRNPKNYVKLSNKQFIEVLKEENYSEND